MLLQMSKQEEVAGYQFCWVRWMRQLLNSDVLDYTAHTTWDMCAGALSCSSSDIGSAFPSNSPRMPGAVFSAVHCSRVLSWLSYVEGNPPAAHLCNPRKLWPWLFQLTAKCKSFWVALSWRASSALTPVVTRSQWWILGSSPVTVRDKMLSQLAL